MLTNVLNALQQDGRIKHSVAQLHLKREKFATYDAAMTFYKELLEQRPPVRKPPFPHDGWWVVYYSFNKDTIIPEHDNHAQALAYKSTKAMDFKAAREGKALQNRPRNAFRIIQREGHVPHPERPSDRMSSTKATGDKPKARPWTPPAKW